MSFIRITVLIQTLISLMVLSSSIAFGQNVPLKKDNVKVKGPMLAHIVLNVSDIKKSAKFYQDLLNMDVTEIAESDGKTRYFLSNTDSHHKLVLMENSDLPEYNQRIIQQIAFEVPDRKSLLAQYQKLKNQPQLELKNNQISWSIYIRDPDNNNIEIFWDVRDQPFGDKKWKGEVTELSEESLKTGIPE